MTVARHEIVTEGVEGFYHCISRCVRRAFLCGEDPYTGKSFEHRKLWVQRRLEILSESFAVEICSFAIMSNHLHVVLRTRPDLAEAWSDDETATRWLMIFPKRKTQKGVPLPPSPAEIKALYREYDGMGAIRQRLASISWFMRSLNENIARRANREDGCKGRFWEGRFKCQALLDDAALLTCMTYVDLNPIRAGAAPSPDASPYTSAFLRIKSRQIGPGLGNSIEKPKGRRPDEWLLPFEQNGEQGLGKLLDLTLDQYLNILDWTGRGLMEAGKRSIPDELAPILERLHVDSSKWPETVENFGRCFYRAAGREKLMNEAAGLLGKKWLKGLKASRRAFS